MSAKIPEAVRETDLSRLLSEKGLKRVNQGKVRDIYQVLDRPNLLMFVTTHRLSIFDLVLNCEVPSKGDVLNAITIFWIRMLNLRHNIIAYGSSIDTYLPFSLCETGQLQKRAVIVEDWQVWPVELVLRYCLTGSAFRQYQEQGIVYGYKLPPGLCDGAEIPGGPIFTPTTKSDTGHDLPLTPEEVTERYGSDWLTDLDIYKRALEYARTKGIIIADTKLERANSGLVDEVFTPDSSRFWDQSEWYQAIRKGKAPTGYDKEPVRQWGMTVETPWGIGLNKLNPENEEHVNFVHSIEVPEEVISATTDRYLEIFWRLTEMKLDEFQKSVMGIALSSDIIIGAE